MEPWTRKPVPGWWHSCHHRNDAHWPQVLQQNAHHCASPAITSGCPCPFTSCTATIPPSALGQPLLDFYRVPIANAGTIVAADLSNLAGAGKVVAATGATYQSASASGSADAGTPTEAGSSSTRLKPRRVCPFLSVSCRELLSTAGPRLLTCADSSVLAPEACPRSHRLPRTTGSRRCAARRSLATLRS